MITSIFSNCGTSSASAKSASLDMCVGFVKFVAVFAVSLLTLAAVGSAQNIFASAHWFQMPRIYATADAAYMIEIKTFRNAVSEVFKCPSVGRHGNRFRDSKSTVSVDSTFARSCYAAGPEPAAGEWLWRNELPESFECCRIASRHVTSLGSLCLGLREAGNFVAARSHFTPLPQSSKQ